MFPVRRGYYYKVDRAQAQRIVALLAAAYKVRAPVVQPDRPSWPGANGEYQHGGKIWVHTRGHMKTPIHEFYHHLDWCTRGKYDSNDRKGGPSSLAWQFADMVFEKFRHNDYSTGDSHG